ncbi:GNAT family N-acetyltransferase [Clostridium sp. AM58-1XD]|uniref:N-acetyltransferase n=1 Tax=Clostridium sp. AM58-1XD TaxID=2292307 RepID=UPI000E46A9EE|nr:GNAT family N-acetyltransferase [Clostridium sp. AM58-1XD]RGY98702.1 GNAT family N-acetyltransferase [Clostridium sp. AM58-1XD]
MELIKLTHENLESEHICCAISNNKDCQVMSKKSWLKERLDEGLVFLKGNVRGKCFIEYIPAEYAWAPIEADGYMYIDCLWVSGQFKGQGYSSLLLDACIKDAESKGKKGLVILSSKKKRGFLSDPKYMEYKGFILADTAEPYFELLYLPFGEQMDKPSFRPQVKEEPVIDGQSQNGFWLFYTSQCPFTAKYVPLLKDIAAAKGADLQVVHIDTREKAQSAPSPFTTFSLYYNGRFITHEILSEKKFVKLIEEINE